MNMFQRSAEPPTPSPLLVCSCQAGNIFDGLVSEGIKINSFDWVETYVFFSIQ